MPVARPWLEPTQRHVVAASFLGWALDAFDFSLLLFVLKDIAADFGVSVTSVTIAVLLTLATRPLGALTFGLLADRYGRRPVMMANILLFAGFGFASGFASSLTWLLVIRACFGFAMGGEWGIGSSLALESVPERSRGFVSGLLQAGYPAGFLLASVAYAALYGWLGWRGLLMLSAAPALLAAYIRQSVPESPAWRERARSSTAHPRLLPNVGLFAFAVALMTAFNVLSHGTQDLFPTLLQQRHLTSGMVGFVSAVSSLGAIAGGLLVGALSERYGRRRMIVAACLLALPVAPIWAFSQTPVALALGAFAMQFAVQGAWGVVPAHLNELSPPDFRGTFPGLTYQLGNLLAAGNATLQATIARHFGQDYGVVLCVSACLAAVTVAGLTLAGREAHGVRFRQAA